MRCFNQVRHRLCFENTGARRRRRVLGEWAFASCPRILCYKQHTFFGGFRLFFGRFYLALSRNDSVGAEDVSRGHEGHEGWRGKFPDWSPHSGPTHQNGAAKQSCSHSRDIHSPDFRPASVPSLSSRPSRDSVESSGGDRAAFFCGAAPTDYFAPKTFCSSSLVRAAGFLRMSSSCSAIILNRPSVAFCVTYLSTSSEAVS